MESKKVILVGTGDGTAVLEALKSKYGEDVIIVSTPEEFKALLADKEVIDNTPFEREPYIIQALPKIEEPYINYDDLKNNKPWYSKFDGKHKKKRR